MDSQSVFWALAAPEDEYRKRIVGGPKDTAFQILISVLLGFGAFFAFCILRPRWPGLYAARKKQKDEATQLPDLPDSLFGWIPVLFRINEQQVLTSAGLDAFVFLSFFKMAIKFLLVTLFFALVVIKPVHDRYAPPDKKDGKGDKKHNETLVGYQDGQFDLFSKDKGSKNGSHTTPVVGYPVELDYLWMYLVFAYFFTGLVLWLVVRESRKIIAVRQDYLGQQSTVTDRTIRLSGIPPELRSEDKIKEFIEELEIGKVESVLVCRNWQKLDSVMEERMGMLRKLEEAMTVHQGHRRVERTLETLPIIQPSPPGPRVGDDDDGEEDAPLLGHTEQGNGPVAPYERTRPKIRVHYGFLNLRYKLVDAIDYYQEKIRRLDAQIKSLRKEDFTPVPIAFVTMDSVASCQMATQAVLDSSPMQLIARPSPAPSDVIWPNTYLTRSSRVFRAWSISAVILILTIFWSILLVPIAGLIDLDQIHKIFPTLADMLGSHPLAKSLVQTQLPTLVLSLLNVLVPYLYDWLSHQQGMISEGDVQLSVISKNFFFVFFNFFLVFTALGTAAMAPDNLGSIPLRDTANQLAQSIEDLRNFYVNYIILQALGLFPFRLLEFGSVFTYPLNLMGAKTPRDYAELVQPPIFTYGFALPQNILIFLICIVYSVLKHSWQILLPGLVYFIIGFYVYKYQLLYAMDHHQHSTGKSWIMVVDRIVVGLIIFQVTVAGQLALRGAVKRSVGIIPLIIATFWFHHLYSRSYKPLMDFIALRSIRGAEHEVDHDLREQRYDQEVESNPWGTEPAVDESRENGLRFINPSMIAPLEDVWIKDSKGPRRSGRTSPSR